MHKMEILIATNYSRLNFVYFKNQLVGPDAMWYALSKLGKVASDTRVPFVRPRACEFRLTK